MLLVAVFISFVSIFATGHSAGYNPSATFFNGSHTFDATVIMISLDGFRADYLDRNITPALHKLGKCFDYFVHTSALHLACRLLLNGLL